MRVFLETILPCPAELAWAEVQKASLLIEVCRPLLAIRALQGEALPDRWEHQRTVLCSLLLFGRLPLGVHEIRFERVSAEAREIQSRERSRLVRRWDHLIRIRAADHHTCLYSDDVTIEAGWRTPLVWLFAQLFYRHRQRRWRSLVRRIAGLSDDSQSLI